VSPSSPSASPASEDSNRARAAFGEESERRSRRNKNSGRPEPSRSASSTGLPHKLASVDDGFASFESQKAPPGATPKVSSRLLYSLKSGFGKHRTSAAKK